MTVDNWAISDLPCKALKMNDDIDNNGANLRKERHPVASGVVKAFDEQRPELLQHKTIAGQRTAAVQIRQ